MYEIKTEIEIAAPAERVWSVLLDFPAYPEWNPFIRSVTGTPAVGARITARVQPEGGRSMTFRPIVLAATPNQELRWRGRFLIPGTFDGEHYFQIAPLGAGSKFVHGERFTGFLVRFAKASLAGGTTAGFVAMNEALKSRAENPVA